VLIIVSESSRGREGSLGLSRLDGVAESSQLSGVVENSQLDGVEEKRRCRD
jgi:hypothetical protein